MYVVSDWRISNISSISRFFVLAISIRYFCRRIVFSKRYRKWFHKSRTVFWVSQIHAIKFLPFLAFPIENLKLKLQCDATWCVVFLAKTLFSGVLNYSFVPFATFFQPDKTKRAFVKNSFTFYLRQHDEIFCIITRFICGSWLINILKALDWRKGYLGTTTPNCSGCRL